jgi:hypothetical protein
MPKPMFIVQARSRQPSGIVKVVKTDRREALKKANDFLNGGIPFVTIVVDGRVYTAEEFADCVSDDGSGGRKTEEP